MTSGFGSQLFTFKIQDDLGVAGDQQPESDYEEEVSHSDPTSPKNPPESQTEKPGPQLEGANTEIPEIPQNPPEESI